MTRSPRPHALPRLARWLLRLSPVPREARDEVQTDLHELFVARRKDRGAIHAQWRLYHDVGSLWLPRRPLERAVKGFPMLTLLHDLRSDLRYAARLFARQPAILLLTIVGLSLGLGIATAAFSIMNTALRGEGLVDPEGAPVVLRTTDRSVSTTWKYDEFLHLRAGATRLRVEAVVTDAAQVRTSAGDTDPRSTSLAFVSGGFFAATGGTVTLGRALEPADDRHTGPPPVVVSFTFWTSRLGQDPAVVGRTLRIGRTEGVIVGVAHRGFSLPNSRLLWMPLTGYGAVYGDAQGKRTPDAGLQVFGRLLPDVALSEAEAQLSTVASALTDDAIAGDSAVRVRLDRDAGLGRMSSTEAFGITAFVFAVIGLVLLLACANVATVLVSTALTREREMGVRSALGASRWRIVRQLVTESLALSTIAAAAGLVVAGWAVPAIGTMLAAPAGTDLAPDLNVFVFLGMVTLVTGVTAGLAPAWHGRGIDLVTPLRGAARLHRLERRRFRSMLVTTQAAASVLLILTAALFVRASVRAGTIDVGFDPSRLYAVSPGLGDPFAGDGAATRAFWPRATSELQAMPGIQTVALSEPAPFDAATRTWIPREHPDRVVNLYGTGDAYFETMGLPILAGRTYTRQEVAAKAPVAVISQSVARLFWPDQSPLGEMLPRRGAAEASRPVVIGVVADAITTRLHERNTYALYQPLDPDSERFAQLLVRVAAGATGVVDHARHRLRAIDPRADIQMTSIAARVQQEAGQPRMLATLSGIVGLVAVILCVVGLYGLTASVVAQRTHEIGVRIAMGAVPGDLLRLLMWESLRPVLLGLGLGAGAALLAARVVVATMFFGVSPQDPIALAGAAAVLLSAAIVAVLVPTRRAAALDAAFVLRQS